MLSIFSLPPLMYLGDGKHNSPVAASPGAGVSEAAATQESENPVDSLHYGTFFAQILVISVIGLVLVAVVWRRMKQRSWYAIPGADTLGTPKEDVFSDSDDDGDHEAPNSTTSTTARVRSPPRRQVPSPRFTIGSDDEEEVPPRVLTINAAENENFDNEDEDDRQTHL